MHFLHSSIETKNHCADAAFAYLCLNRNGNNKLELNRTMAYESNFSSAAGFGLADRFNAIVADYRAKAAQRKIYRDTLNELRNLSNRDLDDLGLNRTMLKRIAYQAAYEN